MEQKAIPQLVKNLGGKISKNGPTILTILAVGGVFSTAIFAAQATPKALQLLDEEYDARQAKSEEPVEPLTKLEVIKITWRVFIPTACMGAATAACIIGSNSINQRRNAALATVYGLTEVAFREYKDKVVDTLGKSKELKLRDEISADKLKRNPPDEHTIILTGKGEVLCYDGLFGQYFRSDIEQIRKAINDLNKDFLTEMWMSVNDLYYALGVPQIPVGDEMGWDLDRGLIGIEFSTQLSDKGEPCLVLNYTVQPKHLK